MRNKTGENVKIYECPNCKSEVFEDQLSCPVCNHILLTEDDIEDRKELLPSEIRTAEEEDWG